MRAARLAVLRLIAERPRAFEDLSEEQVPHADALVRFGFACRTDGIYRITKDGREEIAAQDEEGSMPKRAPGETRQIIHDALRQASKPLSAAELAEQAGITVSSVYHHLTKMNAVKHGHQGERRYSLPLPSGKAPRPRAEVTETPATPPTSAAPERPASPTGPPSPGVTPPRGASGGGSGDLVALAFLDVVAALDSALAVANDEGSFHRELDVSLSDARMTLLDAAVAVRGGR